MTSEVDLVVGSAGGNKNKLLVKLGTFKGNRTLDIRKWYLDKVSGKFQPTSKGLTVTLNSFFALRSLLFDNQDRILAWLNSSTPTIDSVLRENDSRERAQLFASATKAKQNVDDNLTRREIFFEYTAKGNEDCLSYSKDHPFNRRLSMLLDRLENSDNREEKRELANQFKELVNKILITYGKSAISVIDQKNDAKLFASLHFSWSTNLKLSLLAEELDDL